jgi:hypothetical protein
MPAWLKGVLVSLIAALVFAGAVTLLMVAPLRQAPRDFGSVGEFAERVFLTVLVLGAVPGAIVGAVSGYVAPHLRTARLLTLELISAGGVLLVAIVARASLGVPAQASDGILLVVLAMVPATAAAAALERWTRPAGIA